MTAAAAAGEDAGGVFPGFGQQPNTPVVQVWEEDMLDFDDLWTGGLFGAAAAADDDSDDDSNAEGYYANSYPDDEADSHHDIIDDGDDDGGVIGYEPDDDDDDDDGGYRVGGYGGGGYGGGDSDSSEEEGRYGGVYAAVPSTGPAGAASAVDAAGVITRYEPRSRRGGRWQGVADDVDAEEAEEFDADDYVSSGDEDAGGRGQQQQQHGGHGAAVLSGGAAWRAMLAQEFGPVAHGADAADA
ncbi:hypothetical protein OEZ86_004713 [Tetradesmus obliquus]|nr:hypothetical protein OEZ86_004713 [Tetradesmus obliquus]